MTVSDGQYTWVDNKTSNTYSKHATDPQGQFIELSWLVDAFYNPDAISSMAFVKQTMQELGGNATLTKRYLEHTTIQGMEYEYLELIGKSYISPQAEPYVVTGGIYIEPDKLIRAIIVLQAPKEYIVGSHTFKNEEVLTNIQVNKPLPASEFTFVPPPGATLRSK